MYANVGVFFTQQEIRRICTELDKKLTNVEYKWLEEVIKRSENKEDRTIKKKQIRKYESLTEETRDPRIVQSFKRQTTVQN